MVRKRDCIISIAMSALTRTNLSRKMKENLLSTRYLINLSAIVQYVLIVHDLTGVRFEVNHVDLIVSDQSHEQSQISLCQNIASYIPLA